MRTHEKFLSQPIENYYQESGRAFELNASGEFEEDVLNIKNKNDHVLQLFMLLG